jgi:hypothetical protein
VATCATNKAKSGITPGLNICEALVKHLVILALAYTGGICAATESAALQTDPRLGYWIEDRITPAYPQAQGLHVSVEDLGSGRFRYTIGANHLPENLERVEGKCDGGTYQWRDGNGKLLGNTVSCRYSGAHQVNYVFKQGKPDTGLTSTGTESVSEDGSRLTWKATRRDAKGQIVEEMTRQFTRRQ